MSRTKTRPRPAPPRRAKATRKEVRVLIPGHALGDRAFLLMRRRAGRWSVTDSFRGAPAYVGVGEVWQELKPDTAEADLYCWSESQARALTARFVEQAVQIHRNTVLGLVRRIESLAADMAPPEVTPLVLTPEEVRARVRLAEAEVAAAKSRRRAPAAEGISAPAAMDHPDWQPPKRDTVSLQQPLTRLGADIPANWEDETVALDVRRVHGPAQTAVFPVLPEWPPLPPEPPTVHLTHLSQVHPSTGARVSRSVADAMAAAP